MIDRDDASVRLGVDPDHTQEELRAAYESRRTALLERLERAPTDSLRVKYQAALTELDEAFSLLEQPLVAEAVSRPGAVSSSPAVPSLSHTQLRDLPGAAPGYTQGGGAGSGAVGLQPNSVLAERYEVLRLLGRGGMGAVYEAFDRLKHERIAIKVLLPELLTHERARERFLNEARVACRLAHPHIVKVFDVGVAGNYYFITMELLEGQTLRQRIEAMKLARTPFEVAQVIDYARQLAEALEYAHKTLVHRDLKPENVWVTEDGQLKLMDFGIARAVSQTELTKTGMAMGTAYYMAPEQLAGVKNIDARADQYALGVMLYELLTGEIPQGAVEPPKALRRELSSALSQSVLKAMAPRPTSRFASCAELMRAIGSGSGHVEGEGSRAADLIGASLLCVFILAVGLMGIVAISEREPGGGILCFLIDAALAYWLLKRTRYKKLGGLIFKAALALAAFVLLLVIARPYLR